MAAGNDVSIGWAAAGIMRQSSGVVANGIAGSMTASERRRRWVVGVVGDGENDEDLVGDEWSLRVMTWRPI